MVTIVVTGDSLLKNYWLPLIAKYSGDPKYEFAFVETPEEGFKRSTKKKVFFTTYDAIPSYRTMTRLGTENTLLRPKWHSYNNYPDAGKLSDSWTVYKDWSGEDIDTYQREEPFDCECEVYHLTETGLA